MPGKYTPPAYNSLVCNFPGKEVTCLKVVAVPGSQAYNFLAREGKGEKAWIFVDEVLDQLKLSYFNTQKEAVPVV